MAVSYPELIFNSCFSASGFLENSVPCKCHLRCPKVFEVSVTGRLKQNFWSSSRGHHRLLGSISDGIRQLCLGKQVLRVQTAKIRGVESILVYMQSCAEASPTVICFMGEIMQ